MALSISDICENTKVWLPIQFDVFGISEMNKTHLFFKIDFLLQLAREMSLLGNYETASVYYQGVIQQIHRLLSTIDDPGRKQKWQQIQGKL